jgi:hypothetical protein
MEDKLTTKFITQEDILESRDKLNLQKEKITELENKLVEDVVDSLIIQFNNQIKLQSDKFDICAFTYTNNSFINNRVLHAFNTLLVKKQYQAVHYVVYPNRIWVTVMSDRYYYKHVNSSYCVIN